MRLSTKACAMSAAIVWGGYGMFGTGIIHLLGSDGHSTQRRPPHLADAYRQVSRWAGPAAADRVGSILGAAILQGLPLRVPPPQPPAKRWLPRIW